MSSPWRRNAKNRVRERYSNRKRMRLRNGLSDAYIWCNYDPEFRVPIIQVANLIKEGVWEFRSDRSIAYDLGDGDFSTTRDGSKSKDSPE